jgi:O-antigen ligase
VLLRGPRNRIRPVALIIGLLCVAAMGANRQLTSALALGAGIVVVLAVRWRAAWVVWSGAALVLLTVSAALVPPVRALTFAHWPAHDVEGYQHLTTFRLSAWAAAQDMIETRPWLGYGPGTFGAEAQPHRLAAEIALHERLQVPPLTANAFVYAHQDYLQLAAEAGIPVLFGTLGALVLLCVGLLRRAVAFQGLEETLLLAVLITGAVAALAWFPMQIPFTACVLLLACGRAFRIVATAEAPA